MAIGIYKNIEYFLKFYINTIMICLFLQLAFAINIAFKIYSFGKKQNLLILIAFLCINL